MRLVIFTLYNHSKVGFCNRNQGIYVFDRKLMGFPIAERKPKCLASLFLLNYNVKKKKY